MPTVLDLCGSGSNSENWNCDQNSVAFIQARAPAGVLTSIETITLLPLLLSPTFPKSTLLVFLSVFYLRGPSSELRGPSSSAGAYRKCSAHTS